MMAVTAMPLFALDAYARVIDGLRRCSWTLLPVSQMVDDGAGRAFIRHDVDFSLRDALPLATIEAGLGVRATYFVLLSGPYNLFTVENRRHLRALTELGHEIGLHYDLTSYPDDPAGARRWFNREVEVLEDLAGVAVRSACMHQPSLSGDDPFLRGPLLHPHDPRLADGLCYVSDSCRRWRDETLLTCFGSKRPRRLLLNTHPELWLDGSVEDRMAYLDTVVRACLTRSAHEYLDQVVRPLWQEAPGR